MSARQLRISAAGSSGRRWFRVVSLAVAGLLLGLPVLCAQEEKQEEPPAKADETATATPPKADEGRPRKFRSPPTTT